MAAQNEATFTDCFNRKRTIRVGLTYRLEHGDQITVEGFEERDCGADDARTGLPIVYGKVIYDGETVAEDGWAYLDDCHRGEVK